MIKIEGKHDMVCVCVSYCSAEYVLIEKKWTKKRSQIHEIIPLFIGLFIATLVIFFEFLNQKDKVGELKRTVDGA